MSRYCFKAYGKIVLGLSALAWSFPATDHFVRTEFILASWLLKLGLIVLLCLIFSSFVMELCSIGKESSIRKEYQADKRNFYSPSSGLLNLEQEPSCSPSPSLLNSYMAPRASEGAETSLVRGKVRARCSLYLTRTPFPICHLCYFSVSASQQGGAPMPQYVKPFSKGSAHIRRREIEKQGVQAGIEGTEYHSFRSPLGACPHVKPHQMGYVIRPEAHQEIKECHNSESHSSAPPLGPHMGLSEHDPHKAPVAEDGDHHGDKEEDKAQLKSHTKHQVQLGWVEVLVAGNFILHCDLLGSVPVLDNDHDGAVTKGHDPGDQSSNHSIQRPAGQLVLHGESHSQVALDADARQEPCAPVDATVEAETCEGTDYLRQFPPEFICSLNDLEGQQQQQQEVRQCQAEQEDVDRCRLGLADPPNEGTKGQEVGRETSEEDNDIGREDQGALQA